MQIPSPFTKDQAINDCLKFSSSPILNESSPNIIVFITNGYFMGIASDLNAVNICNFSYQTLIFPYIRVGTFCFEHNFSKSSFDIVLLLTLSNKNPLRNSNMYSVLRLVVAKSQKNFRLHLWKNSFINFDVAKEYLIENFM